MKLLIILLLFPLTAFAQLPSLGEQKTLVILVNFTDKQETPFTTGFAEDVVFNQVNAYYLENSYNQTWLTGDVVGWYTIASSYTTCNISTIASQAEAVAIQAGHNVPSYSRLIYMFPANNCPWLALATIGGSPSQMWKKGQPNFPQTTHEFGHNLGLWHSRSLDCGPDVICTNGTIDEYGDRFDIMGPTSSPRSPHFNLFQKEKLGWTTPTVVTAHGDYVIDNLEPSGLNKGLKIAKSPGVWYYIEKRSAFGYDSFITQYPNVINGVLIHIGYEGTTQNDTSHLLDASPPNDWFDPALTVGHSFVDTEIDLGVTLLSVNPTGAVVRITCAACVPPADNTLPTVQITSPLGQVARNTTVSVQATASDNVGVDRVEIRVNNVLLCSDTSVPYSCSWAIQGKKRASYTLTARAYDAAGNVGIHSAVVVV